MTLLAAYSAARFSIDRASDIALESFEHAQRIHVAAERSLKPQHSSESGDADMSLWSNARIASYRKANAAAASATPLAVLRIPALSLRVPVFEGTDALALDRGAGYIEGTGKPGGAGNVGLAAHRDGFFRVLKDARVGQTIYLDLLDRTIEYRIAALHIVEPSEVGVLADVGSPRLTLVTCYPFYFVGPAPQRFIVRAELSAAPHAQR